MNLFPLGVNFWFRPAKLPDKQKWTFSTIFGISRNFVSFFVFSAFQSRKNRKVFSIFILLFSGENGTLTESRYLSNFLSHYLLIPCFSPANKTCAFTTVASFCSCRDNLLIANIFHSNINIRVRFHTFFCNIIIICFHFYFYFPSSPCLWNSTNFQVLSSTYFRQIRSEKWFHITFAFITSEFSNDFLK